MTNLFRITLIIIFLSGYSFTNKLYSQNLYDYTNSKLYAEYLFYSGEYKLAAEEYNRLVFLKPKNDTLKFGLLKSYRLSGDYDKCIFTSNQYLNDTILGENWKLNEELSKCMLLKNKTLPVHALQFPKTKSDTLSLLNFQISYAILNRKWNTLENISNYENLMAEPLKKSIDLHTSAKYKNKWVAGLLSSIIPGFGKIYTGRWKDGLISLILIAGNTWQSYRGFHKFGIKSGYGWVFGGLASGFYLANIYGSSKSAIQYNENVDEKIIEPVHNYLRSLD